MEVGAPFPVLPIAYARVEEGESRKPLEDGGLRRMWETLLPRAAPIQSEAIAKLAQMPFKRRHPRSYVERSLSQLRLLYGSDDRIFWHMRHRGSWISWERAEFAARVKEMGGVGFVSAVNARWVVSVHFNVLRGVMAPLAALALQGAWRRHVVRERARRIIQKAALDRLYRPGGWAVERGLDACGAMCGAGGSM